MKARNESSAESCLSRAATVVEWRRGSAAVRITSDCGGCEGCAASNRCALYAFGAIFSSPRAVWRVPAKRPLAVGTQVQLRVQSAALLKVALLCYALPIAALLGSAILTDRLFGVEWLTVLVGLGSLVVSNLLARRWLRGGRIPNIQLMQ